jgi:hypothetical protein
MPELRDFDLNLLVAFDLLMQEQNVARGGTHIRQPVGDEPHPAETVAATGRSIAGQDALRHEANGQGGIGTLTYKWASACATRFGHESHLLCPSTHRNRNRDRNEYFAPDIKRRGLQLRQKPGQSARKWTASDIGGSRHCDRSNDAVWCLGNSFTDKFLRARGSRRARGLLTADFLGADTETYV